MSVLATACTTNQARHALDSASRSRSSEAPPQGRVLADFSDAQSTKSWTLYQVQGVDRPPQLTFADGALRVQSNDAAGVFFHDCRVDTSKESLIGWRWRVSEVFPDASPFSLERDNFPARVLVGFDASWEGADEVSLSWKRKVEQHVGNTPPARALCYNFGGNQPSGEAVDAWFGMGRIVVINLRPPDAKAGQWYSELRDVASDYAAIFGERAPAITHLAVSADTHRNHRSVIADFDDFVAYPVTAAGVLAPQIGEHVIAHSQSPLALWTIGAGGLAALVLVAAGAFVLRRRKLET
ncbi:MAG: DUF3047 domain-containing protein [Planctomycetes bacterium]|nr:DUF3047 domain-containing protein [Planctomycetota bacterium]